MPRASQQHMPKPFALRPISREMQYAYIANVALIAFAFA